MVEINHDIYLGTVCYSKLSLFPFHCLRRVTHRPTSICKLAFSFNGSYLVLHEYEATVATLPSKQNSAALLKLFLCLIIYDH